MENSFSRNSVIETLKSNICVVEFTKLDGSVRSMRCTLMDSLLPPQKDIEEAVQANSLHSPAVPAKRTKNAPDNIVAYDLDAQGWRTFNVNRVIKLSVGS